MLPSYCVYIALVSQIAVFIYLKPIQQLTAYAKCRKLTRTVNAYRVAGLLLVLVAVAHGQDHAALNRRPTNEAQTSRSMRCTKGEWSQFAALCVSPRYYIDANKVEWTFDDGNGVVYRNGVQNSVADQRAYLAAQEARVKEQEAFHQMLVLQSDMELRHMEREAAYMQGRLAPKPAQTAYQFDTGWDVTDKILSFMWVNIGKLLILAVMIGLWIQFGTGRESDETNIEDQFDPAYRTGFDRDYHGDDAFEVPDGMETAYRSVPVRKVGA